MGKLVLLLAVVLVVPTAAFLAPTKAFTQRSIGASTTSLQLSSNNPNHKNDQFSKARTDIRNFLTQRSIQSFVFLLNQCREDHTVRWLEKTLDFTSIDNFHGTGAFNQTKFPEWDSVFLECVDRPEETIVIQMRQRRRQQKLSGHNAYFESLSNTKPMVDNENDDVDNKNTEKPGPTKAFSTGNYLDAMSPTDPKASCDPKDPKIASGKLSSAGNYLDHLSSPSKMKAKWSPSGATNDEKKKKEVEAKKNEPKPGRRGFASANYLENLSAGTSSDDVKEEKTQQSTEESKNPYLEEKTKEYELSIDPPALVRRMLSVREHISKEWVEDLDMLMKLNDEIADSFEEYNAAKNDENVESEEDNLKIEAKDKNDEDGSESKSDIDVLLKALIQDAKRTAASNEFPGSEKEIVAENDGPKVLDREILNIWSSSLWSPKRSSSCYRKFNFDLLLLLATQESVHRVLNSYKNDDSVRPQTHEWLLDFYVDNVNEYFDGHQTYARSDDFLKEMIQCPRTLVETNTDILAWTDPAIIAEDIVRERSEVILDWMKVAESIFEEHTDLRRLLFTNMVSKSVPGQEESPLPDTIVTAVDVSKIQQDEDSASSLPEVFGAFE